MSRNHPDGTSCHQILNCPTSQWSIDPQSSPFAYPCSISSSSSASLHQTWQALRTEVVPYPSLVPFGFDRETTVLGGQRSSIDRFITLSNSSGRKEPKRRGFEFRKNWELDKWSRERERTMLCMQWGCCILHALLAAMQRGAAG